VVYAKAGICPAAHGFTEGLARAIDNARPAARTATINAKVELFFLCLLHFDHP
jgi:hypothetical protein